MSQCVVISLEYVLLEHVQVNKTERKEKKTAHNGHDAGGLLVNRVCIFTHKRYFTLFNTTAERAGMYSLSHSLRSFL